MPVPCATQCVIGAGAAGLVAARELLREGHRPTVFEQGSRAGGVWVYTEATEEGVGAEAEQARSVHSSMYRNLRTNLPREVMSYADFPFTRVWRDGRRFCSHQEVRTLRACEKLASRVSACMHARMHACGVITHSAVCVHLLVCASLQVEAYLEAFAEQYDLQRLVQYDTRVVRALPCSSRRSAAGTDGVHENGTANGHADRAAAHDKLPWPRWQVTTEPSNDAEVCVMLAGFSLDAFCSRNFCFSSSTCMPCCRKRRPLQHRPSTPWWSATGTTACRAARTCPARAASRASCCTATATATTRPMRGSLSWSSAHRPPARTSAARSPLWPTRWGLCHRIEHGYC